MKRIAFAFLLFAMLFAYRKLTTSNEMPLSPGAIGPRDAASHFGQTAMVEGVAHVHVKNAATFIDMGGDYPFQAFQAVIFPDSDNAFGDLNRYDGKTVAVTGRIREHNGTPEIVLNDPGQLSAR